jgi:hypothetical protein
MTKGHMSIYSLPPRLFRLEIRLRHQLSKQILNYKDVDGIERREVVDRERFNTLSRRYSTVSEYVTEHLDKFEEVDKPKRKYKFKNKQKGELLTRFSTKELQELNSSLWFSSISLVTDRRYKQRLHKKLHKLILERQQKEGLYDKSK